MLQTPRTNWLLFAAYLLASLAVFVAALVSPIVRAVAYAPLRDLLLPPPRPITITLLYSTEKEDWLKDAIARFEKQSIRVNGHPVQVQLTPMGSREMVLEILDGKQQPDLISPASTLQAALLEDQSPVKFGRALVHSKDPTSCQSALQSPLVLAAWKERASVLWGAQPPADLWKDLHDALVDPNGWQAYNHPDWGYIKFGHTSPLLSNSGLMTVLLMADGYYGAGHTLQSADILSDAAFQKWFLDMENAVPAFGESTGSYMKDIIAYGPSTYDIVAVYEATAIEQAQNALGRYGELHFYYPPLTITSDHPFCVLDAEWVSADQKAAAQAFIQYLLTPEIQQLALTAYGFRPVEPSIQLTMQGSPFLKYSANGLMTTLPPSANLPSSNTINTLMDFWSRNIHK